MRLRIELVVHDLDASIRLYEHALSFHLARHEPDYVNLELGDAILGLGPIAKRPAHADDPGFTRGRLASVRGAGVEIVLEVPNIEAVSRPRSGRTRRSPNPCAIVRGGLQDFRLIDPDGYYVRISTRRQEVPKLVVKRHGTPARPSASTSRPLHRRALNNFWGSSVHGGNDLTGNLPGTRLIAASTATTARSSSATRAASPQPGPALAGGREPRGVTNFGEIDEMVAHSKGETHSGHDG